MTRNVDYDQKTRDERRERILSHARKLFAANGLSATKISDIAAAAQMSQGLLYHYFRSKEEVFTEIIREAFQKMNAAARQLESLPMAPSNKIRMAFTQLLKGIEKSEDFANTVLLNAQAGIAESTPPEARDILRKESGVPYEVVANIIRAGQQDGTIRQHDPDELSMLFWTTIKGLALHKAVYGKAFRAPDVQILTRMFFTDQKEKTDEY